MEELDLHQSQWDCCVIGNGVSALWLSHWLWSSKKSVIWISSEDPYNPARALLRHGWLWAVNKADAQAVTTQIPGFDQGELPGFEAIYYDARSSRRFRRFGETRQEYGDHEKDFFEKLDAWAGKGAAADVAYADLWTWYGKLMNFHDGGQAHGLTQVEVFSEPRFVRVQGWPIVELNTADNKLTGVRLAGKLGKKSGEGTQINAEEFYLGDFDEALAPLVKDEKASERLAGALKGRVFRPGFGLQIWHKGLTSYPTQTAIVPLVVNPEKGQGSHVVGRIVETERGVESYWIGFLTDEEVEDNNEILKKIKQARRALERAIPGFGESAKREAVTFEPRMWATDTLKNRKTDVLGAALVSDYRGAQSAVDSFKKIFGLPEVSAAVDVRQAANAGANAENGAEL